MASSTLIWFPIVLYIDLEGESFWYQCYICQFSCVYMVYQNMWGGGCRKTLFILGKIKQFFFNERSILVKLLSVFWQFWLHNLLLDLSTIFLTCIMFWVSLLRHKKRLDVLSTHRFPPFKRLWIRFYPFLHCFKFIPPQPAFWNRCQSHCFHILTKSSKKGTP